jgi:hypothetical protein
MVTTFREMKRGVEKQRRGREKRARRAEHELWLATDTDRVNSRRKSAGANGTRAAERDTTTRGDVLDVRKVPDGKLVHATRPRPHRFLVPKSQALSTL